MTPSNLSPPVRADSSERALAFLTFLSTALLAALALVPARLAARGDSELTDRRVLAEDVQAAFVAYWRSGEGEYPPELTRVVDFWIRYSVLEAAITAVLLVVLVTLGCLLWSAHLERNVAGGAKRLVVASVGTIVWGCVLTAVWTLTASIQGAAAPFGALLPLLREGAPNRALSESLSQVRHQLAQGTPAHAHPPALAAIVDDYVRFHVVHALAAAPTALAFLAVAVVLWKRTTRAARDRRSRRSVRSVAALCLLAFVTFGVICAANVATAADPEPGLLGFFEGGW